MKYLGMLLLALPFLALAAFMYQADGWRCVFIVYGGCLLLVGTFALGTYLINKG